MRSNEWSHTWRQVDACNFYKSLDHPGTNCERCSRWRSTAWDGARVARTAAAQSFCQCLPPRPTSLVHPSRACLAHHVPRRLRIYLQAPTPVRCDHLPRHPTCCAPRAGPITSPHHHATWTRAADARRRGEATVSAQAQSAASSCRTPPRCAMRCTPARLDSYLRLRAWTSRMSREGGVRIARALVLKSSVSVSGSHGVTPRQQSSRFPNLHLASHTHSHRSRSLVASHRIVMDRHQHQSLRKRLAGHS